MPNLDRPGGLSRIGHIILRRQVVERDWKLAETNSDRSNGRKHLVNELWPARERPIVHPEWNFEPESGRTPVLETGHGGTEIATMTEHAGQDRHKHLLSTETYIVLKGTLRILIDDEGPIELDAGDEVIILPGTVHEIVRSGPSGAEGDRPLREPDLLVRVHALNCHGAEDKYVQMEPAGAWIKWSELRPDERRRAYRKQPAPQP